MGFDSLSMLVDRRTGRTVSVTAFETRDALALVRKQARHLREQFAQAMGARITDIAEMDIAVAHLRRPGDGLTPAAKLQDAGPTVRPVTSSENITPTRGLLPRTARLAALPAAYAGRTALGLGQRPGGCPPSWSPRRCNSTPPSNCCPRNTWWAPALRSRGPPWLIGQGAVFRGRPRPFLAESPTAWNVLSSARGARYESIRAS